LFVEEKDFTELNGGCRGMDISSNSGYDKVQGLLEMKLFDEAEEIIEEKLDLTPEDPKWVKLKGVLHAKRGEYEKAEELFLESLSLNSEDLTVMVNLGNIYLETGHHNRAEEYYKLAMSKDPSYETPYYNLSALYKKKRQYGLARKYMKEYDRRYLEKRINEPFSPGNRERKFPGKYLIGLVIAGAIVLILLYL